MPLRGLGFSVQRLLAPRLARAQHVEADAGDDGGQPAAEIVDTGGLGAAEPQPGFLHGIVGFPQRTQHAVGHALQAAAMGLELPGEKILVLHGHISPTRFVTPMTAERRPM